jgi:4-methylaminobutanoate oxidase (formaldehyde-forming)
MTHSVKLDKPAEFLGKRALLAAREAPLRKKLIMVRLDDPAHYAWGGEGMIINGEPFGELTSAGWSAKAGACLAMGYARGQAALRNYQGEAIAVELWGNRVPATAWDQWPEHL